MFRGHSILSVITVLLTVIFCSCGGPPPAEEKKEVHDTPPDGRKKYAAPFETERHRMTAEQIESRGVKSLKVIEAMREVPRHEFVPEEYRDLAYSDMPLPIGYGQTISQPYIVALMTELLNIDINSRVLEIGTGSGYQAAILSHITKEVYSVEIVKGLHERASESLERAGFRNIRMKGGDGYYGWEEHAPYDAIIVTCASEFIPPPLISQLKNGGRICIPVGPPFKVQHLLLVTKSADGDITVDTITEVRFVPLVRKEEEQ